MLSGSVADVFDVAQSGYASDSHVFVDVDVTCGTSGDAVGLPVGVGVVSGPASSLGASSHCVTRVGTQQTTRSTGAGQGCVTYAVTRPVSGDTAGRSTHLLRIPDTAVGQMHQLLVWIDADRDRAHDPGEPYQYVAADFVARSVGGATLADYGLPADFVVEIIPGHSTRIGRAGLDSELRLRLVSRSGAQAPIAEALVGVRVSAGPSGGTQADCVNTDGTTAGCRTDTNGEITVRYRVGTQGVSILRRSEDTIAVFGDPDQDGQRQFGAPTRFVSHPIAKTINYVALGDSYSSGEQGHSAVAGFVGSYQGESSDPALEIPNQAACRRWSEAYPQTIAEEFLGARLGVEVTFVTFACAGAITHNVFDPRPVGDGVTDGDLVYTNRPSHNALELDYNEDTGVLAPAPTHWEPRQAVSLANVQAMSDVDMVTLTIGGNDAGFADVLQECVLGGLDCDRGDLPTEYGEVSSRVAAVLAELKRVAPNATIFLLGYPYITPEPIEVNRVSIDACGLPGQPLHATGISQSPISALLHRFLFGTDRDLAISYEEARFMWSIATELNNNLATVAGDSGVHFVDVSGSMSRPGAESGFLGHSPCGTPPWLNGFISQGDLTEPIAPSSFHPNRDGHDAYAQLLQEYIRTLSRSGAALNESGLPLNPDNGEA